MAVEIVMPAMEMAQDSARLVTWLRDDGEYVRKGEPVMEIETDKVTVEIEAPGSGVLARTAAQPGDDVPVGAVVAYLLEEGEQVPAAIALGPIGQAAGMTEVTIEEVPRSADTGDGAAHRLRPASPKARRLAGERGIDLVSIVGTGPDGVVLAADIPAPGRAPLPIDAEENNDYGVVPIVGMRRTIADRVQASYQTAPHISLSLAADMAEALGHFQQQKAMLRDEHGVELTVTALIAFVLSRVLHEHRRLNAHLVGNEIREFRAVHLGVAVALEDGLIVPVIHDAHQMGLAEIQAELDRLVSRARTGTLSHDEVSRGTFTLSNLGMFGIRRFTAIVNPPQVGIAGVGAIDDIPVGRDGEIVLRPVMHFTLNVDHRAIDGAVAARFLQQLKRSFEDPSIVLV